MLILETSQTTNSPAFTTSLTNQNNNIMPVTHIDGVSLLAAALIAGISGAIYFVSVFRKDRAKRMEYEAQQDAEVGANGNICEPPHSYDGTHDY